MPASDWHVSEKAATTGCYYRIIDDTGFPEKGRHSTSMARQYSGEIRKRNGCQVVVSLSIGTQCGSLPIAWKLYVAKEWINGTGMCP
jgi:SRSO17 transposase